MRVSALMDYTKIQQDVVKYTKQFRLGRTHNGWVGIVIGSEAIIFMPKQMCLLDIDAVSEANKYNEIQESFFKGYYDAANMADKIDLTTELKMVPESKKPLVVFVNKNNEKIYVNTAYLDYFKTGVELNYKGTDYRSPVFIYSCDELIGLVLPVNVRR
jgi:hypothetical protein